LLTQTQNPSNFMPSYIAAISARTINTTNELASTTTKRTTSGYSGLESEEKDIPLSSFTMKQSSGEAL
jgi:hypothetical protein